MNGEITINGNANSYINYGVRMGEGFVTTLTEPLSPKAFIENESRLNHGKEVITDNFRIASRDLTLDFVLCGKTPQDLADKKQRFLAVMYAGDVSISIPEIGTDVYHLVYLGKGTEYGINISRTTCHMVLKFCEPNPTNRS